MKLYNYFTQPFSVGEINLDRVQCERELTGITKSSYFIGIDTPEKHCYQMMGQVYCEDNGDGPTELQAIFYKHGLKVYWFESLNPSLNNINNKPQYTSCSNS